MDIESGITEVINTEKEMRRRRQLLGRMWQKRRDADDMPRPQHRRSQEPLDEILTHAKADEEKTPHSLQNISGRTRAMLQPRIPNRTHYELAMFHATTGLPIPTLAMYADRIGFGNLSDIINDLPGIDLDEFTKAAKRYGIEKVVGLRNLITVVKAEAGIDIDTAAYAATAWGPAHTLIALRDPNLGSYPLRDIADIGKALRISAFSIAPLVKKITGIVECFRADIDIDVRRLAPVYATHGEYGAYLACLIAKTEGIKFEDIAQVLDPRYTVTEDDLSNYMKKKGFTDIGTPKMQGPELRVSELSPKERLQYDNTAEKTSI